MAHTDHTQDSHISTAGIASQGAPIKPGQRHPTHPEPGSHQDITTRQHTKTTNEEITVLSERALMALTSSGLAATVMTSLMLADGASWPHSLIVGLGAGGGVLVGIVTILGRGDQR
ncbi:hypothetical protein GCM10023194_74850 [Planotetraspora phitsanulokensis]|uniref:Uncharacterized protein n=1 Tax=Planotetraspora phitsanulokensis TaxID=575192 RepID=A0A8J3U2H5_9ACTN|nr:hypothetical protein [Planotetraspora phitsanulokensis]GII37015.1 hypothetical protein Pph01_20180 [Planotetraspora phitsanulokensis]